VTLLQPGADYVAPGKNSCRGPRFSATSPFSELGSRKSWDLWALL
jgi:hypothetical protein